MRQMIRQEQGDCEAPLLRPAGPYPSVGINGLTPPRMLVFVFILRTSGALSRGRHCLWWSASGETIGGVRTIRPSGRSKAIDPWSRMALTNRLPGRFSRVVCGNVWSGYALFLTPLRSPGVG